MPRATVDDIISITAGNGVITIVAVNRIVINGIGYCFRTFFLNQSQTGSTYRIHRSIIKNNAIDFIIIVCKEIFTDNALVFIPIDKNS